MIGKTIRLPLAVFLAMSLAASASATAEPLKLAKINMAEALNAQWQEQTTQEILYSKSAIHFHARVTPIVWRCTCACGRLGLMNFATALTNTSSKHSLGDNLESIVTYALLESEKLRIIVLDPDGRLTGTFTDTQKEFLYSDFLIRREINTKEILPKIIACRWLQSELNTCKAIEVFEQKNAEEEIKLGKEATRFTPNVVFDFKGKVACVVELDLVRCLALIRFDNLWGLYKFSEASADSIFSQINALHAIYADEKPGEDEN